MNIKHIYIRIRFTLGPPKTSIFSPIFIKLSFKCISCVHIDTKKILMVNVVHSVLHQRNARIVYVLQANHKITFELPHMIYYDNHSFREFHMSEVCWNQAKVVLLCRQWHHIHRSFSHVNEKWCAVCMLVCDVLILSLHGHKHTKHNCLYYNMRLYLCVWLSGNWA